MNILADRERGWTPKIEEKAKLRAMHVYWWINAWIPRTLLEFILIKGMLDRDLIMTAAISCQFLSLLHGAFQSMSAKSGATIR